MRRFVNGDEIEFDGSDAIVDWFDDLLIVRSQKGTYSGLIFKAGDRLLISYQGRQYVVTEKPDRSPKSAGDSSGELRASMPGAIVDIRVQKGVAVVTGDVIIVLEAMKTHLPFTAPFDGIVGELLVTKGEQVTDGALLAIVRPNGAEA